MVADTAALLEQVDGGVRDDVAVLALSVLVAELYCPNAE
jgi:hypothetical protein